MRWQDLENLLGRLPCPLIRLHLTDGKTFDIQDPEQVVVTFSTVEFLMPGEKNREAILSLNHIIWAEVVS